MALPSSGQISMSQVNVELGYSSTARISLDDDEVRLLANKPAPYATGGTISTSGGYRIHTFTTSGTLSVSGTSDSYEYLVVAGGGGGGGPGSGEPSGRGGGGAGGVRTGTTTLDKGHYTITVGNSAAADTNGNNSSIGSVVVSTGGGRGATTGTAPGNGGSGGGGNYANGGNYGGSVGTGTSGQGYNGGLGYTDGYTYGVGGGGGGRSGVGGSVTTSGTAAGNGGPGWVSSITGSSVTYGGGGGGGGDHRQGYAAGGAGGAGGGGAGAQANGGTGGNGVPNTGGGGGGAGQNGTGGAGGSGIVVVRYPAARVAISLDDLHGKSKGPPAGYIAWYDYSSFNSSTLVWSDKSGNGYHAQGYTSISQVSVSGNGSSKTIDALRINYNGGNYGSMLWPSGVLPSTYTLFHVCRYTGTSNNRIIRGYSENWLSGFWNNTIKCFYHNGWISNAGGYGTDNNWHYTTDQNNLGRQDGSTIGSSGAGSPSYDRITINQGGYEYSECDIAEVIVYNSTLNSTQYGEVETYLKNKYGL